jgi:predicted ATP-grasp superfamily ATP-dependent carboligase
MTEASPYRMYGNEGMNKTALVVGWAEDAGKLGVKTADYLIEGLGCREVGEIVPEGFFPMSGVNVEDDVALFPSSRFYANEKHDVVVFKSNVPRVDWFRFLNALLDAAKSGFGVTELYTLGAMVSASAHTMPRQLVSVVNSVEMKSRLEPFNVTNNTDYETPPGQKPTLSSYLLWVAGQRGVQAAALWVPVPYYLVSIDDPRALRRLVYFFNSRFEMNIDLATIDNEIAEQSRKISNLFEKSPEIEKLVRRLETGEGISNEETEMVAREMMEFLRK